MEKAIYSKIIFLFLLTSLIFGCARDLSSNVYTSDSTLSLTLEGQIVSSRPVIIKDSDKLSDNTGGIVAGGVAGAALGSSASKDSRNIAIASGALVGAAVGAIAQGKMSHSKGYEYIVKVDVSKISNDYYEGTAAMRSAVSAAKTNGLITVLQSADNVLNIGQKVYVIFSEKRTRVIAR